MDQRMSALEAYIANTDPTAPLKDTNGNVVVADTIIGNPGPGHNAWLLTSTAFVLFMTLPGLALFYGGMVRNKNVLSVLAQCFLITGLVTILWVYVGYGMIFGGTGAAAKEDVIAGWVGSPTIDWMLKNVTSAPNSNYSYWVSENVLCDVPVDVRRHHAGAHHRFHCGTHEVQGHLRVHDIVDADCLFHPGPRGLGH